MDENQDQSIEAYWQELKAKEFPHVVPFNRAVYERVAQLVKNNPSRTKLDFILDCIDKDVESNSFRQVLEISTQPEESFDFLTGYPAFIISLISAQLFALHGSQAAEEYLDDDVDDDLKTLAAENMKEIADTIKTDPSGSHAAQTLMQKLVATSNRKFFIDGVHAARDTFMAYSQVFDKFIALSEKKEPDTKLLEQGNIAFEVGNYEEGLLFFSQYLESNPLHAEANYNCGVANLALQRFLDAVWYFTKSLEINPDQGFAYYQRGLAYGNLRKYSEAIKDYSRAIELLPDFADAYFTRGTLSYHTKNDAQALSDWEMAVKLDPGRYTNELMPLITELKSFSPALVPNEPMVSPKKSNWKSFVGKNVIITLKPWSESKDRDSLESSKSNLPSGYVLPDLIYRAKVKFEARLESVGDDKIDFFVLEERFFSFRSRADIISIELVPEKEEPKPRAVPALTPLKTTKYVQLQAQRPRRNIPAWLIGLMIGVVLGGISGCASHVFFDRYSILSGAVLGAAVGAIFGWRRAVGLVIIAVLFLFVIFEFWKVQANPWKNITSGHEMEVGIGSIVIDNHGTVFAVRPLFFGASKIFSSSDVGKTWDEINTGNIIISSLAVGPHDHLFAGTSPTSTGSIPPKGILVSRDGGGTWMGCGLAGVEVLSMTASGDGIFAGTRYYGVYRSSDDGISWIPVNLGLAGDTIGKVDFFSPGNPIPHNVPLKAVWNMVSNLKGTVFASCTFFFEPKKNGLYYSTDRGESWLFTGLSGWVTAIGLDNSGGILAGVRSKGIFQSRSGTESWSNIGSIDLVTCLAAVSSNDILIGTERDGLFSSSDSGKNWVHPDVKMSSKAVVSITQHPAGYILIGFQGTPLNRVAGGVLRYTIPRRP